jgi:hypothetical protein
VAPIAEADYGRFVPPQYRRFLPLLLIAAFIFILIPALTHRSHKSGLSDRDKATRTIEAMKLVEAGEQSYRTAHGRFTSHLVDLLASSPKLADDLAAGLDVRLDASTDGRSFLAQVTSDVLSIVRARTGATSTARSCLVLKKSSGVQCPAAGP